MDRLTKRVGVGEAVQADDTFDLCMGIKKIGQCKTGMMGGFPSRWERGCNDKCVLGKIIDRLAAYEDTGLTPEQCAELAKADADGRIISRWCAFSGDYDCPLRNVKDVYCKESLLKGYCQRKH